MLYLYNSETEEFLGQGKTMQELNDAVRSRFPDKLFNVPQEELDKFMKKHKKDPISVPSKVFGLNTA